MPTTEVVISRSEGRSPCNIDWARGPVCTALLHQLTATVGGCYCVVAAWRVGSPVIDRPLLSIIHANDEFVYSLVDREIIISFITSSHYTTCRSVKSRHRMTRP